MDKNIEILVRAHEECKEAQTFYPTKSAKAKAKKAKSKARMERQRLRRINEERDSGAEEDIGDEDILLDESPPRRDQSPRDPPASGGAAASVPMEVC